MYLENVWIILIVSDKILSISWSNQPVSHLAKYRNRRKMALSFLIYYSLVIIIVQQINSDSVCN